MAKFWGVVGAMLSVPVAAASGVIKGAYDAVTGSGTFKDGYKGTSEAVIDGAERFGTEHSDTITHGIISGAALAVGGAAVRKTIGKR